MPRYPHLKDAPQAFGPGREVFEQIPGEFDYARWGADRAHARLMTVPWCGDYENVVAFGSDEARDAWIDAQPCHEFDMADRRAPERTLKVDVPYTSAVEYNYLVVDLPPETSEGDELPGVSTTRVSRFCYFVTDCEARAGSTTNLFLSLDVWTTFINRVAVRAMTLECGHAPMAETSADEYLTQPNAHASHLMTPDVAVGGASFGRPAGVCSFNDTDMYLAIASTSDWDQYSGGKYGVVAARPVRATQDVPATRIYAVDSEDGIAALNAVTSSAPALIPTIKALFLVQKSLVQSVGTATVGGVDFAILTSPRTTRDLLRLDKSMFGYDGRYENIAKLYTSPYAVIEVTDGNGAVRRINVEDTNGNLELSVSLSLVWPSLAIDCQIAGVGATWDEIYIRGLSGQRHYSYFGSWTDAIFSLSIPTFEVFQRPSTAYDYQAHYVNAQRQTAASNQLASELASNSTARTNAANSADNVTANNAVSVGASTTITAQNVSSATSGANATTAKVTQDVAADLNSMYASLIAEQAVLAVAATNNDAQATANAAGTVASGIVGTVANAATGNIAGAIGSAVSAIGGLASQGASWSAANASIAVSQSNSQALYAASTESATQKNANANTYTETATTISNTSLTNNTATQNSAATSIASNNASLINTNAQNTKTTADANANRSYDTATSAIANDTAQAALTPPLEAGAFAHTDHAVTRPLAIFANVRTANPGEIQRAGDKMLRYGYDADFYWELDDWQPCEHFCYWRGRDVWCAGAQSVAERYQSAVKEIIMRGTTVWSVPEEIGQVSIYDNGF